MIKEIWSFSKRLFEEFRLWPLAFMVLIFAQGLIESLTVAALLPFLSTATNTAQEQGTFINKAFEMLHLTPDMKTIATLVVTGLSLSAVLFLAQAAIGARLMAATTQRWQQRMIETTLKLPYHTSRKFHTGDILALITTEAQRLNSAVYQFGLIVTALFQTLATLAIATLISWKVTVFLLIGGATIMVLSKSLLAKSYRVGEQHSKAIGQLNTRTKDILDGLKYIKATASEDAAKQTLTPTTQDIKTVNFKSVFGIQVVKAVFDFGGALLVAATLFLGVEFFGATIPTLLIVLALFVRLIPRLTGLQQGMQGILLSIPALRKLESFEKLGNNTPHYPPPHTKELGRPFTVSIEDISISHKQENDARTIIENMNLQIGAGELLAITGPSGAGKSTLLDAIIGLIPTDKGTIAYNGQKLTPELKTCIAQNLGYVGQDTILFFGTIKDNLLWGNPYKHRISNEDMVAVLDLAGLKHKRETTANFLNYEIGENGSTLSGGERQRLALARALLREPGLLILDEATASLDEETEQKILETLQKLKSHVTMIMITHKPQTTKIADQVMSLGQGG